MIISELKLKTVLSQSFSLGEKVAEGRMRVAVQSEGSLYLYAA